MTGPNYSAECAMRCGEARFRAFLAEALGCQIPDKESAAEAVRTLLDLDSRAELNHREDAAEAWKKMRAEFETWEPPKPGPPPFLAGQQAWRDGVALDANPHHPDDGLECYPGDRANWHQGWHVAMWTAAHDQRSGTP